MKVDQAGGADAFDIAAVGRDIQVGLEYLVLVVEAFQFNRSRDLLDLSAHSSRVDAEPLSRKLHRNG